MLILMIICFLIFAGMLFIPAVISIFKPQQQGIVIIPDKDTKIKIKYIKENQNGNNR